MTRGAHVRPPIYLYSGLNRFVYVPLELLLPGGTECEAKATRRIIQVLAPDAPKVGELL
jgi:hypothetical protein